MAMMAHPKNRFVFLLPIIACAIVIAFVLSRKKEAAETTHPEPSTPDDPVTLPSTTPLPKIAVESLIKKGDSALTQISSTDDLETQNQIASTHLSTLVPYPQQTIAWLEKLNEQSLGDDHQQWNQSFLEYQASLPQPPAGSFPFSPRLVVIPDQDEDLDAEAQAEQALEKKEREQRIAKVKFLITLYRDLLGKDQMLFPTAELLPSLGPIFTSLVEDGEDSTFKERITRLFENLDDLWIHQLLAIERIESPLMADLIRRQQDKWLLPLALQSPALAGKLAGHLIPNSVTQYDPLNDCFSATRNIGKKVAREGGLVPLAQFLGAFLKQCPAYGIRLEESHMEVIKDAWKNHLANMIAKQPDPTKPDWDHVYRETFIKLADHLAPYERAILAFGMRSFLYTHFDTFSYSSPDQTSVPPRIVMRHKLAELLAPYPKIQICVVATFTNLQHDFQEESQVTATHLKSFLLDQTHPFYLRFQIAKQAIQIQYRGTSEFDKMAPALTSILCEFVDKGYSDKEVYAGHILTEIRKQAETSENKPLWQEQCAKVTESWSTSYLLPNSIFKKNSIHTLNELLECALASGDKDLIDKMISDHSSLMQGNFPLIGKLILAGKTPQAASLCQDLSVLNRNYRALKFTSELELKLPLLLSKIKDEANRFIAETHLSGRDNPFEGAQPTTTKIDRLRALAQRYPAISFPSPKTEVACLTILCSEPSVAWLIKDELNQKVGDLKVSEFKKRGPQFEKRGLGRFSDMRLYNAHLGNLTRAGDHESVQAITREIMARTKEGIDHGAWMLGDLLRVLYDHFLVMAKDGRAREIATYHHLSRELYHLMVTHHKGWNYRNESLAIMVFCYAAAKKFDQLLPWSKKTGGKISQHFQEYHSRMISSWSPRQNPFSNLAIFSDLRGSFDTPELAPHRRAGALILMEDPTLLKEATPPDFLTHCAKYNVNRSKVLTFEDVIAILETWKKRHPEHPGWPKEYAIAQAALKKN